MRTILASDPKAMGAWVAKRAAADLCAAIDARGHASLIVATGASQFEVLNALIGHSEVDWSCVTGFHLDEYVGLAPDHPASFCRYLQQRFVSQVPLAEFHWLRGDEDPQLAIQRVGERLSRVSVDVALVGIGENGHLAFNDPPADFDTQAPYLIVDLDQACREQQVGEGWFDSLDDVPRQAISMSVRQILLSQRIYCSVPDERKSTAVRDTIEGPMTPHVPASILQTHAATCLVIDRAAASKLSHDVREALETA